MKTETHHISSAAVWQILQEVMDPEVPVLSITDLGIVRSVEMAEERAIITVTPTYSGCPAMDAIRINIRLALLANSCKNITIKTILSPAWTTDWMTEAGKAKLKAYGIAPPNHAQQVCTPEAFQQEETVSCPLCNCCHTQLISQFSSTACKALYKCSNCKETFDYFKCH